MSLTAPNNVMLCLIDGNRPGSDTRAERGGKRGFLCFIVLMQTRKHFCLDFRIVGKHRFDVPVLQNPVYVVVGQLDDDDRAGQHTDQVRDHHQSVEGVRNVPCQRGGHERARHDHQHEDYAVNSHCLDAAEIFHTFGAVVRPAEYGRVCEQKDAQCDKFAAECAEYRFKRGGDHRGIGDVCGKGAGLKIDYTGGQNDKRGHCADDDGVCKYLKDAPHALLDRLLDVGVGVNHDRRAETCFVGEDSAFEALGDYGFEGNACGAAPDGTETEGVCKDRSERSSDLIVMNADDHQRTGDEEYNHDRHDFFGNCGNALQSADDDKSGQKHQDDAENQRVERDVLIQNNSGKRIDPEGVFKICNDLVDLSHISDAEGGEDAEHGKQDREHLAERLAALVGAETVLQVVHCTAGPLSVRVSAAEIDAQDVFRIVGHHAEEGCDPHPEDRARTADRDGCGDTGDVAHADRCREGGAECLELGNHALFIRVRLDMFFENTADGVFPPVCKMSDLEKFRQNRHDDAGSEQEDDADGDPHKGIDAVVDFCNLFKEFLHKLIPFAGFAGK